MQPASLPAKAAGTPAPAEALAVPFGPLPFSAMRRVRRVLTDTPRSRRQIAEACGSSFERTSAILTKLVKAGLAKKAGAGYVRSGTMPIPQGEGAPMEIGRQILLCLTEPRRAKDIARIIDRPPSNTTGQLQHLLRRGLVVRVSKGVYDLARAAGHPAPGPRLEGRREPNATRSTEAPSPAAATLALQEA